MSAVARRPAKRRVGRALRRPRVQVDVGRAGTRGGLSRNAAERVVRLVLRDEGVSDAAVSVTFVSDAAMRRLNARHLGRRADTDVIAFGLNDPHGAVTGDVYVSPGAARRAADVHGVPLREELVRLVVHGVLHVTGHDHPAAAGPRLQSAMWRRQEALVIRALSTVFP